MKKRIWISLICFGALSALAIPEVQAADFGPRAMHIRPVQAAKSTQTSPLHDSSRIVRTAGPRETIRLVRDINPSVRLAAVGSGGCSERRAGPRATVCL
ncbi:MAG TPA: hypothetical protein VIL28_04750 [Steroidobacteraceae bacterium]